MQGFNLVVINKQSGGPPGDTLPYTLQSPAQSTPVDQPAPQCENPLLAFNGRIMLLLAKLKKLLLIASSLAAVVVPSSLLTIYFSDRPQLIDTSGEAHVVRDFEQVPFDAYDATLACTQEAHGKFGRQLLRTSVDWHSTRLDQERNLFMVVLYADVGTLKAFEAATVYCYISRRDFQVSYFKAFDSNSRDMFSKRSFDFADLMKVFN